MAPRQPQDGPNTFRDTLRSSESPNIARCKGRENPRKTYAVFKVPLKSEEFCSRVFPQCWSSYNELSSGIGSIGGRLGRSRDHRGAVLGPYLKIRKFRNSGIQNSGMRRKLIITTSSFTLRINMICSLTRLAYKGSYCIT